MSSVVTPVSALLDPSCGVPPDIVFKIIGATNFCRGEATNKTILGEVRAHKTILALRAPVFLRQFHGEFPCPAEVNVEDTSLKAFKTLIGFIYEAEDDWASLCLQDVFQVAGLADKYLLPSLMEKAIAHLLNFKISDENLLKTAAVAEDFCLLSEASSTLLDHCASFIKEELVKSSFYSVDLAKRYSSEQAQAMTVMKLLARVTKPEVCSNCGVEECRDGKRVMAKSELAEGARLKLIGPIWNVRDVRVEEKCTVSSLDVEDHSLGDQSWEIVMVIFDDGETGMVRVSGPTGQRKNLVFRCK